ncbi:MAG TPA: dihydrodipicolinate synthase family protein [Chthonomonadaceae bacterium]|nr:dihydrodipicolinate synthase family protein [Chthonomonadaceae bacterium]
MPETDSRLRGVMTAILTPMDMSGRLMLEAMPALIDFQRAAGIDGIVVCGTNGEGTSLTVEERKQTLEAAMRRAGGLTVVAGTGAANAPDTIELTCHAAALGVDAALVLPPFFFKSPASAGLTAYFESILDAVELPVLLYNIPQMTSVPITDALLRSLAGHPRLAGVKDSAGDWPRTDALIRAFPELAVFSGSDYLAERCLGAGGAGCISGGANPFPETVVAVRDAFVRGDTLDIEGAQQRLDQMLDILVRYPFVGASKSVLANRGLPRMGVRPPLVNLTADEESAMLEEFRSAGFAV